jgi:hypothetical protein
MAQLLSLLLLVGFWWIAAAAAVVMAVKWAPQLWERHRAAVEAWKAEQHAIAARADQQHAWTLARERHQHPQGGQVGAAVVGATPGGWRAGSRTPSGCLFRQTWPFPRPSLRSHRWRIRVVRWVRLRVVL